MEKTKRRHELARNSENDEKIFVYDFLQNFGNFCDFGGGNVHLLGNLIDMHLPCIYICFRSQRPLVGDFNATPRVTRLKSGTYQKTSEPSGPLQLFFTNIDCIFLFFLFRKFRF